MLLPIRAIAGLNAAPPAEPPGMHIIVIVSVAPIARPKYSRFAILATVAVCRTTRHSIEAPIALEVNASAIEEEEEDRTRSDGDEDGRMSEAR